MLDHMGLGLRARRAWFRARSLISGIFAAVPASFPALQSFAAVLS
jgi:hypothetical protein